MAQVNGGKMQWKNVEIELGKLAPWEDNPKSISEAHAKRLLDVWERFGQFQTVAIGPNGEVYDGHQRLTVLKAAFGEDYTIQALQSPRELSYKERQELTVASHVGTTGDWDWDKLEQWDTDDLESWGLDYDALKSWHSDADRLQTIFGIEAEELWEDVDKTSFEDENYSRSINSPEYVPTGDKPSVGELFDDTKTKELIEAINAADDLSDDERRFLLAAAQRHTVFDFGNIAEYYAHSDIDTQTLMEDSALVIVDFKKAISSGFVRLTDRMVELVGLEYDDDD